MLQSVLEENVELNFKIIVLQVNSYIKPHAKT